MKQYQLIATIALFGGLAVSALARDLTSSQVQDKYSEIANRFIKRLGLSHLEAKQRSFHSFDRQTTISYGAEASLVVDRRGIVVKYQNERRLAEQLRRRDLSKSYRITSEDQVKRLADSFRMAVELPATYQLEGVRYFGRNGSRIADTNREGVCTASFSPRPNGYWFYSRGMQTYCLFDPLDGALLSYTRMDDSVIESSKITISPTKARALASAAIRPFGFQVTKPRKEPLAYTCPNGLFGGIEYPREKPYRLRLAYGFDVRGKSIGTIWIDAADGRVLGGSTMN